MDIKSFQIAQLCCDFHSLNEASHHNATALFADYMHNIKKTFYLVYTLGVKIN